MNLKHIFEHNPKGYVKKTEVLADIKKFGRRMRLKEFFHDKNNSTESETSDTNENDYETRAFIKPSTFTPKPNREPVLDLYLTGKYLENSKSNISTTEREALISLRKNKNTVIFEADKGGAVVIMNKSDCINEAKKHLNSVDAGGNRIYKELSYDCTEYFVCDVAEAIGKQLSTKL